MPPGRLREFCPLDAAGEKALEMSIRRLALSARAHDRILKVARTIADIGGAEQIQAKHRRGRAMPVGPAATPDCWYGVGEAQVPA